MKFAAVLGVKDEVEVLPKTIAHLHAIGVEKILVRDYHSTDGSGEWLRAHAGDRLEVVPASEEEATDNDAWARSETELAWRTGADWVLLLDADELWLPAGGSLHACAQLRDPSVDVLGVERYNVAVTRRGALLPDELVPDRYHEVKLFVRPPHGNLRRHLEQNEQARWISGVPVGKVAVRPERVGLIHLGHHGASGRDGQPLEKHAAQDLLIAHLPFTTPERFGRKVANITSLIRKRPDLFQGQAAWHWKRWAAIAEGPGGLAAEFLRQQLSDEDLRALEGNGTIRSAAQVLEAAAET